MNSRYILMNKNNPLAELAVTVDGVYISRVLSTIPQYIDDINYWVHNRFELFGRNNIIRMAKLAAISTQQEFLTITKAISINDTFWVNDILNPITWDKINPYRNRISRIMAEISINGIDIYRNQNLRSPSPQYKIDGQADKCVKRVNGELTLYKTDGEKWSDLAGCRPYSEYFASAVYRAFKINNFVDYSISEYKTNNGHIKPYCKCKIFTTEDTGLVQCRFTPFAKKDINELLDSLPLQYKIQLKNMALMDSIILNIDRHLGNYGFIYDNNTFRINALAPIYDNDCSLGATVSLQDKTFSEAYEEIITRHLPKLNDWDYNEQALWGMTDDMYNKLKTIGKANFKKNANTQGLSNKRMEFINYIINRRIQEILKL